jgi:hypothetical protein
MTETPSFSIGKHGFSFHDPAEVAPLADVVAQRDRLWRELAIEDKAAVASQMELLTQLLAMRSLSTLFEELEGKPNSAFFKAIFCFMTQFQLSIFQFLHHQCKGDKKLRAMMCLQSGAAIINSMQAGMDAFLKQEESGEL